MAPSEKSCGNEKRDNEREKKNFHLSRKLNIRFGTDDDDVNFQ